MWQQKTISVIHIINSIMKQRDLSLDIIRLLACAMVVMMHSPIPTDSANGIILSTISYLTTPCIGLFFMVSGALLLPPPISKSESALPYLRKRLSRVLMPTLVWTVFYIAVKQFANPAPVGQLLKTVVSIPFSAQGHGVLWFMYTLVALYLLTPILHTWLTVATEKDIRFYLQLWLIAMCYPILKMAVATNDTTTGILYYFSGYVGYYLLGYWLQRYPDALSLKTASVLMAISIAAPVAIKLAHISVDFYEVFWYLSVFVVAQCVFWWKVAKWISSVVTFSGRTGRLITICSNLTFGIYLSHIFIMRQGVWKLPFVEQLASMPLVQTIVVAIITLSVAIAFSWAVGISPLGNAVVGWRYKRK